MQLTPRFGTDPVLVLDVDHGAAGMAAIRQRERLVSELADLDAAAWSTPSRCFGWSAVDVINHLHVTNGFWTMSIGAALAGVPTRLLETFDPVATPAALAAMDHDLDPRLVLERFAESTAALVATWQALSGTDWAQIAEAPAGHVAVGVVTHHALWDSWIHERDVLVPLGIEPPLVDDELEACLLVAAALGPALAMQRASGRSGRLSIHAAQPALDITVDIADHVVARRSSEAGDLHLDGLALELVEILSVRRPLPSEWSSHPSGWMLRGLREQFDQIPGTERADLS